MIAELETVFMKNRWTVITQRMGVVSFPEIAFCLNEKHVDSLENLFPAFWNMLEENKWNVYHIDGAPTEIDIALKVQEYYGKPIRIEYNEIETSILCDKLISSCENNNYFILATYGITGKSDSNITKELLMKHIDAHSLTKKQFLSLFWNILEKECWFIGYDDDTDNELEDREFIDSFYNEF